MDRRAEYGEEEYGEGVGGARSESMKQEGEEGREGEEKRAVALEQGREGRVREREAAEEDAGAEGEGSVSVCAN